MVILGAAGAGKSVLAIKLVRDILADWTPSDRVPILLPAATWTRDVTMTEWIAEQLVRSQPSLDMQIRTDAGETVALPRALADSGVIPVIDGLDELPHDRRAAVIAEINAYGSDYPLVLTSRPEEYYAAAAARSVSEAVVIELDRLQVPEMEKYLTESTAAPFDRWQRVFAQLESEPEGVLALALATPLMMWLARTVYEKAESDPAELLDPARLADRGAIESHLISAFVPALYSGRRRRSRPRSFRCTPDQARRWLGFLADRLSRSRTQEIAWWRLSLAEPGFLIFSWAARTMLYTCIFWWVSVWALTHRGYWRNGAYIGNGHYRDLLLAGPLGHAIRPLANTGVRFVLHFSKSVTVGRVSADVDSFLRGVVHLGLFPIASLMAVLGLLTGAIGLIGRSAETPQAFRMTLRSAGKRVLAAPLGWLAVMAFFWWYAAVHHQAVLSVVRTSPGKWVLLWLGLVLVGKVARSVKSPIEVTTKADPVGLLRADRRAYLVSLVRLVAAFGRTWLWAGGVLAVAYGAWSAVGVLVVVLLGGDASAWTQYLDARLRLVARGRLPWRTISFLNDAHRRGILRQTGAIYQFRHIRLQEQLAATYSPWPRLLEPVAIPIGKQRARFQALLPALAMKTSDRAADTAADSAGATEYTAEGEIYGMSLLRALRLILQIAIAITSFLITVIALKGWTVLLGLACTFLLSFPVITAIEKLRADIFLTAGHWSIRVTPDMIELRHASRAVKLTIDDLDLIAVRPIRTSRFRFAVQAKLRSGLPSTAETPDQWLPLFWTPFYSARIPRAMVSALAVFAGDHLDHGLATWLRNQNVTEYEANGTVEVAPLSTTLGSPLLIGIPAIIGLFGLFVLTSSPVMAVFPSISGFVLIGIVMHRLYMRSLRRGLPQGAWSLHVHADAIEVTREARRIRISPNDVESIEFHPVRGKSVRTAIYARLRSETAARLNSPDGWFPIYWDPNLDTEVPPDLARSLAVFAAGRLTGSLKSKAERAKRLEVPIYR